MTKKQLEKLVKDLKEKLLLQHWKIIIDWDNPLLATSHDWARINRSVYYDQASLQINPILLTKSPAFIEKSIIHELVHLLLAPFDDLFASLNGRLGTEAKEMMEERFTVILENVVDKLATILSDVPENEMEFIMIGGDFKHGGTNG